MSHSWICFFKSTWTQENSSDWEVISSSSSSSDSADNIPYIQLVFHCRPPGPLHFGDESAIRSSSAPRTHRRLLLAMRHRAYGTSTKFSPHDFRRKNLAMASYYDYFNYGPADYNPPEPTYYDPEPSYDPEPEYYDPEPPYDDDVSYDNQDYADAPMDEIYEDYGPVRMPTYPRTTRRILRRRGWRCGYEADYLVQGGNEDLLEDEQSPVEDTFAYTAHVEAPCAFADVLEAEGIYCPDAVAWADEWVHGPPSGECVATWESEIRNPESPSQLTDAEALSPAPPHVLWMADHLDAMQYALQQGHVPDDERAQYAQTLAELCADQLADERVQAAGWIWDEEHGDYWHPDHGYTADDPELAGDEVDLEGQLESVIPPDDEPADFTGAPIPEAAATPTSTEFFEHPPCPVDLPTAYNIEANFVEDAHQTINILSLQASPSPPLHARPPPTARKRPIRMLARPSTSSRRTIRSQPRIVQRSASARPKGKTRRAPPRRARSCPDFKCEAPPHLLLPADALTPSISAAVPDTVQCKAIPPNIAGTAVTVSPPPKSAIRARSCSPPTVVSPMSPPIPPDIPLTVTTPAVSPSAERRCNVLC
ncbi:hypothetical protein B0H10DRAFT_1970065 [Mycena sp. CBHHK59/15]|nr:hypothetical protein B0H10DRAFT_1970065 [Mycena sp. CBHHK59/15]